MSLSPLIRGYTQLAWPWGVHACGRSRRQRLHLKLAADDDRGRPSADVCAAPASSRLAGGSIPSWGQVDGRAAREEAAGRESEPDDLHRHHRPVLWAHNVREGHGVPQDHVCVGYWPVLQGGNAGRGVLPEAPCAEISTVTVNQGASVHLGRPLLDALVLRGVWMQRVVTGGVHLLLRERSHP